MKTGLQFERVFKSFKCEGITVMVRADRTIQINSIAPRWWQWIKRGRLKKAFRSFATQKPPKVRAVIRILHPKTKKLIKKITMHKK